MAESEIRVIGGDKAKNDITVEHTSPVSDYRLSKLLILLEKMAPGDEKYDFWHLRMICFKQDPQKTFIICVTPRLTC
jgi:hypothetical protein